MKIALFSDVHANFPALHAAFEKAEAAGASSFLVAGDLVGSGPHPVEVIRLLIEKQAVCIAGNSDLTVLKLFTRRKLAKRAAAKKKKAHLAWTAKQLPDEERDWLAALPREKTLTLEGLSCLMVHGSPAGNTDYIYPSITADGLRAKLGGLQPQVLICGHSHLPFSKTVAGVRVVNCGSVGRPADGDPQGSFIMMDAGPGGDAHFYTVRFAYQLDELIADLDRRRVPGADASDYRLGVKAKGV